MALASSHVVVLLTEEQATARESQGDAGSRTLPRIQPSSRTRSASSSTTELDAWPWWAEACVTRESSWVITCTSSCVNMLENVNSRASVAIHSADLVGSAASALLLSKPPGHSKYKTDNNVEAFTLCNTRCCSQSKERRDRRAAITALDGIG